MKTYSEVIEDSRDLSADRIAELDREIQEKMGFLWGKRCLITLGAIMGIGGTFTPWVYRPNNNFIWAANTIGIIGSLLTASTAMLTYEHSNYLAALQKSRKALQKNSKAHEINTSKIIEDIEKQRVLAEYIQSLPEYQQKRYIMQYGLQGLFPSPPAPPQAVTEPQVQDKTIKVAAIQAPPQTVEGGMDIDYSWLDDDFIKTSKGVFGAKGSGKSTYLYLEAAAYLQTESEHGGTLAIGDLHYRPGKSGWLRGLPEEIITNNFILDTPDKITTHLRWMAKELQRRINEKDDTAPAHKFILDEFSGYIARIDDDTRKEVMSILQFLQWEGRKYGRDGSGGIQITLGLHSIKKEKTGIDSSVLANMDLLMLGMSVADTTNRLPADFDIRSLTQELKAVNSVLKPQQGRGAVVRKLGDEPRIVVIPFINEQDLVLTM